MTLTKKTHTLEEDLVLLEEVYDNTTVLREKLFENKNLICLRALEQFRSIMVDEIASKLYEIRAQKKMSCPEKTKG